MSDEEAKRILREEFIERVKKDIFDGSFKTRTQLEEYINSASNNASISGDELYDVRNQLLKYYDEKTQDLTSLNMEGISSFEVPQVQNGEKKQYIKIRNDDGSYSVIDNTYNGDQDFVEEYKKIQQENPTFQTENGKENAANISEYLKDSKEEVNLQDMAQVNVDTLTPKQRMYMSTISQLYGIEERNLNVDPERNIFVDKDSGEIFYVNERPDGQLEVRKATENEPTIVSTEYSYTDQNGVEAKGEVDDSFAQQLDELSDDEVQLLIQKGEETHQLDDKQINFAKQLLEKRKAGMLMNQMVQKPVVKQYIKRIEKPRRLDGFTSIVFLCLLTSIYGIMALLYIAFANIFGK